jgi:ParB family chromosome partitioning protein
MSRKSLFPQLANPKKLSAKTLLEEGEETQHGGEAQQTPRVRIRPIMGSTELLDDGASTPVGAIGQSLNELSARTKRADELEKKLSEGFTVVELDASCIDPSFINDRMPSTGDGHSKLVQSLLERGQQVPILVRPNPEIPGRYQVAYGHRRLRALAELGRPVKAIVRALSDDELVVAQGQENIERKDLSYIEKARFAHRLQGRFRRDTIMAAMSLHKSDLSNMLSVVQRIPEDIVTSIGPAPTIGRRGWIELADYIAKSNSVETVRKTAISPEVQALDSDERFRRIRATFRPQKVEAKTELWSSPDGKILARVSSAEEKISVIIDKREAADFADFVMNRLHNLFLEFRADHKYQSE